MEGSGEGGAGGGGADGDGAQKVGHGYICSKAGKHCEGRIGGDGEWDLSMWWKMAMVMKEESKGFLFISAAKARRSESVSMQSMQILLGCGLASITTWCGPLQVLQLRGCVQIMLCEISHVCEMWMMRTHPLHSKVTGGKKDTDLE